MNLTKEQRELLEGWVARWGGPGVPAAISAALATIDAQAVLCDEACTEIAELRAQADRDRDTMGRLLAAERARIVARIREEARQIDRVGKWSGAASLRRMADLLESEVQP